MQDRTHCKGLISPYSHKRLFSSVNQDVSTQMVISDEGLATALIVTNKWPLVQRRGGRKKNVIYLLTDYVCVCTTTYM